MSKTWIYFSVGGHTIRINNSLEHLRELVSLMKRWRHII